MNHVLLTPPFVVHLKEPIKASIFNGTNLCSYFHESLQEEAWIIRQGLEQSILDWVALKCA